MTNKSIILVVVFFGLIVFGMFQYTILKKSELATQPEPHATTPQTSDVPDVSSPSINQNDASTDASTEPKLEIPPSDPQITAEHTYVNGEHTVTGVIVLPNPCYELSVDTMILESYPEQVKVHLTTNSTGGVCAQVITEVSFEETFRAAEEASITVWVDGELTLTL